MGRERRGGGKWNLNDLPGCRNPSSAGQAVVRRMDRVACLVRRKVRNVETDRWQCRLARVFVVAYQKLARPEDVKGVLIENAVGSLPTVNLRGQGTQRLSRREELAARMGLEHERRGQHDHGYNPETK